MLNLDAIGKYIVMLRTKQNMTQQDLADALFVTHQAVSKWETGKALPNIDILVHLTSLFQITIDELLQLEVKPKNQFSGLLNSYPREYILKQLLQRKIPFEPENILYLLQNEERERILTHIINQEIETDIPKLFPYLNEYERKRMIRAIFMQEVSTVKTADIFHLLSDTEKKIILRRKK